MNQAFQAAATLGITVCCASGDSGAVDNAPDGQPTVDFPASSPYVLGCGGTRLPAQRPRDGVERLRPGRRQRRRLQRALSPGRTGRSDRAALQAHDGRGVPDVAGDADPATGYNVAVDGQATVVGGTSAVAPLWAALIALLQPSRLAATPGFVNPALYAAPSAHDRRHCRQQQRLQRRPPAGTR